ncbi:MAG: hypothetical protein J3K34DRAFT_189177 [Monoraphidium minutum]|nr:MAG: hypothetical protein J3K34DRAFT_189177 [Monoraphidium minutum]
MSNLSLLCAAMRTSHMLACPCSGLIRRRRSCAWRVGFAPRFHTCGNPCVRPTYSQLLGTSPPLILPLASSHTHNPDPFAPFMPWRSIRKQLQQVVTQRLNKGSSISSTTRLLRFYGSGVLSRMREGPKKTRRAAAAAARAAAAVQRAAARATWRRRSSCCVIWRAARRTAARSSQAAAAAAAAAAVHPPNDGAPAHLSFPFCDASVHWPVPSLPPIRGVLLSRLSRPALRHCATSLP